MGNALCGALPDVPTIHLRTSCIRVRELREQMSYSDPNIKTSVGKNNEVLANINLNANLDITKLPESSLELILIATDWKSYSVIIWLARKIGTHYDRIGMTAMEIGLWLGHNSARKKWITIR
jgi:hypothetical protein